MQRQAPETMKPPGSQPEGLSPRQRAKLLPAQAGALGKDVGGVRPPSGGGPYQRHEVQGRTWADDCPGPAILPAPAADQAGGARIIGPPRAQPAPTSSAPPLPSSRT